MATSSIYLDTKYRRKDKTFKISIRVTHQGQRKYYFTGYYASKKSFKNMMDLSIDVRGESKAIRAKLISIKNESSEVISGLSEFTFHAFEDIFLKNRLRNKKLVYHWMTTYSNLLFDEGRISTSESYKNAMVSFRKYDSRKEIKFGDISSVWLNGYEKWMTDQNKSVSTVGIYLRNLSRAFTYAIEKKAITYELYPFGKGKFVIPSSVNNKRALSFEQVNSINAYNSNNPKLAMAKDMFIFSYLCNGMNFADVANLKWGDINGEFISFKRGKTKNRIRKNQRKVEVAISHHVSEIISRNCNDDKDEGNYIFGFYNLGMTEDQKYRKKKQCIKDINFALKLIAKDLKLNINLTLTVARHSYATISMNLGQSIAFIQKSLGHTDSRTTENYLGSIEYDSIKEHSLKLLEPKKMEVSYLAS